MSGRHFFYLQSKFLRSKTFKSDTTYYHTIKLIINY